MQFLDVKTIYIPNLVNFEFYVHKISKLLFFILDYDKNN